MMITLTDQLSEIQRYTFPQAPSALTVLSITLINQAK